MSDREQLCREVLERVSSVDRLRAASEALRAAEQYGLAMGVSRAIRQEHWRISFLAHELGLPALTLTRDVAAFARAQLGLPIDAPAGVALPRRAAQKSWRRDLDIALGASAA